MLQPRLKMSHNNSGATNEIYKYFRGKWKTLGTDERDSMPKVCGNEFRIKNLDQKTIIELEELLNRQEKILKNKAFISKLSDKGRKIKDRYEELQNAVKFANEKLQINETNTVNDLALKNINDIEWTGTSKMPDKLLEKDTSKELSQFEHAEDDESNPLQLLARHSVEYLLNNRERYEEEEDSAEAIKKELEKLSIKDAEEEEEKESSSRSNDNEKNDNYTNYFGQKCLNFINERKRVKKEPFRPYRSLKCDGSKTASTKSECLPSVKAIPLEESLKLLAEAKNKECADANIAAAKSLSKYCEKSMCLPTENYLNYRDLNDSHHVLDEEEDDLDIYSAPLSDGEDIYD